MKGTTHILAMPRRTMSLLFRPTMSQASTCSQSLSAPLSLSLFLSFLCGHVLDRGLWGRAGRGCLMSGTHAEMELGSCIQGYGSTYRA